MGNEARQIGNGQMAIKISDKIEAKMAAENHSTSCATYAKASIVTVIAS